MLLCAYCPDLVYELDQRGNTALHVAAEWDQLKILCLICEAGDDRLKSILNEEGRTAIEVAYDHSAQLAYPYLC